MDLILRAIEALSTMDDYSEEICLNNELVQLVKELIELPDKSEVFCSITKVYSVCSHWMFFLYHKKYGVLG